MEKKKSTYHKINQVCLFYLSIFHTESLIVVYILFKL